MSIFASTAPRYWAKGLPVIPLMKGAKKPFMDAWTQFCSMMPSEVEQQNWLANYPDGNIGLPLGPQSGLCMIDIDTDDPKLIKLIRDVLYPFVSPWERVGKKGLALAYRIPEGGLKTFRIKQVTPEGAKTLVECLSVGTQLVLPPSIHPDTGRPYHANVDLVDVLDDLPTLPRDTETLIRGALVEEGIELSFSGMAKITEYVSTGARDNKMIQNAGFFAQGVTRGEITLLEAIGRLNAWFDTCVEKVAGDEVDIRKGIQSLIGFQTRDVLERHKPLPPGWDLGVSEEMKTGLGLQFTTEHEEWTLDQLNNYFVAEVERHGVGSAGWLKAVEYLLERLHRSQQMTSTEKDIILRRISQGSAKNLTIGTLNKRLRELDSAGIEGTDHTEIAQEVVKEIEQYGVLKYTNSTFWQWGGSHWEEKDDDDIFRVIAEKFGSMAAARRRNDHSGIIKILATLCKVDDLKDTGLEGVNFANGYLTEDLELLPHRPEFGCTYTLPFRYLPQEAHRASGFHAFLDKCWDSDVDAAQKKLALQEAMAATLFGIGAKFARVALLYGIAGSGKSQCLRIVESLVPESMRCALPPDKWSDRFGPALLAGKLLNVAGELSEHKKIDGQKFKEIVDASTIHGEFKNQQPFYFRATAMHWFASNHLPKTEDYSDGFNRRWLVIHFPNAVKDEDKVLEIGTRLIADEREQIVAWTIEGLERLKRQRIYTLPASHLELMKDTAQQNNSVRYFIEKGTRVRVVPRAPEGGSKTSHHISEIKLYEEYLSFSYAEGLARRVTLKEFTLRMKELGPGVGVKRLGKQTPAGFTEFVYENLTLVGRMAA